MFPTASRPYASKIFAAAAGAMIVAGCISSADSLSGPPEGAAEPPQPSREAPKPTEPADAAGRQDAPHSPGSRGQTAPEPGRKARHVRKAFDPIRDNGPIFVGWPAPKLAIVVTGRQDGYLEPCGCAGLDRMRGGLSRRQTMIDSLRQKGWPLVLLDVGGLSKRFGPQAMLKFRTSVEAMAEMGYQAIALGTCDLRFPASDLVALVAGETERPSRFVSANVGLFGLAAKVMPQKQIFEAAGIKLGVTSVLGKKYQHQIHNSDLEMADPETALAPIVAEMRPACDLMILLAYATTEESLALARRLPVWDVVVTADGPPVPPAEPMRVEGSKTLLIQVGEKVKDAVVLGLFDDPKNPLRYQKVPLDARFPPSAKMKALMDGYLAEVRQLGLEGLGVRAGPYPRKALQGDFAGSKKCATCHEEPYDTWRTTAHARAMRTLTELDPPRHFDPECLACHVTGWHVQGCYPYESGYLGLDSTPQLTAVGCEDCHGPGARHSAVEAEAGADESLRETLRKAVALTKDEAQRRVCPTCHDVSNSPDFDFEAYWPDVAHSAEP